MNFLTTDLVNTPFLVVTCCNFHVFCIQVHIEFTEGEDKITLEGPTKDVQMVQSQIEAIVTDLVSNGHVHNCVLDIDPKLAN